MLHHVEVHRSILPCMMEAKVEAKMRAKRVVCRSITLSGNPAFRTHTRGTIFSPPTLHVVVGPLSSGAGVEHGYEDESFDWVGMC
jgi:hypothetical protein